jgi:taurine--2-oxoglutarate transaminase
MGVMATLYKGLRERGVYAFGRYNIVCIAPPLMVTEAELDEAFEALDAAVGDLEAASG